MPRPTPRAPEDELFARFRTTQDPDALAAVYKLTADSLRRFALQLLGDAAAAEDATQQTFLRAIERAYRYDDRRPLMPWLHRILVNETRVWRRRHRRLRENGGRMDGATLDVDPQALALHAEFRLQVDAAIQRLPERYQPVLRLRLLHGLANPAIAASLNRPAATVRIQLMRGLELLRRALPASLTSLVLMAALPAGGRRAGDAAVAGSSHATAASGTVRPWLLAAAGVLVLALTGMAWSGQLEAVEQVVPPRRESKAGSSVASILPTQRQLLQAASKEDSKQHEGLRVRVLRHDSTAARDMWVRARPLAVSNPYLHDRWLQTGAEGLVRFADLPPGPVQVLVDRGGQERSLRSQHGVGQMTMRLPQGYSISGHVVDDDGLPVAGAGIWLSTTKEAGYGRVVAYADARGHFQLRDVVGEHYVGARALDRAASWLVRTNGSAGEQLAVRFTMDRSCGRVLGVVRDQDQQPVPFAEVIVGCTAELRKVQDPSGRERTAWSPLKTRADRFGCFVVTGVPAGRTTAAARAPGFFADMRRIRVAPGGDSEITFTLGRGAIHGQVTDPRGQPVVGARVGCNAITEDWRGTGAITDAEGRFRIIDGHAGHVALWVDGGRFGIAVGRLRMTTPGEVECNVAMAEAREPIQGVLRGPSGAPLVGWTIDARAWHSRQDPWRQRWARTDENGRFSIPGAADKKHTLFVLPPGSCCPCGSGWTVRPGDGEQVLQLAARNMPKAGLRGSVVDSRGRLVPGAELTLSRCGWVARTGLYQDHVRVSIAPDGTFAAAGLPPGEYRATVYADGYRPRSVTDLQLIAGEAVQLGVIRLGNTPLETIRRGNAPLEKIRRGRKRREKIASR